MGDVIPPNQGSNPFQDSCLNRTPRENCYISGYKVPNGAWTVMYLVKILDLDDETGTRGILYKFAMLNNPKISHLGKFRISPTW